MVDFFRFSNFEFKIPNNKDLNEALENIPVDRNSEVHPRQLFQGNHIHSIQNLEEINLTNPPTIGVQGMRRIKSRKLKILT